MEAAIAVGVLVAVLALVLAAMAATVLQLRCTDAASEAARLASRGDATAARRAAAGLLPVGAEVRIDDGAEEVVVTVRAAPLGSALPGVRVSARAVAAREPDAVAPTGPGPDVGPDGTAPDPPSAVPGGGG